MKMDITLIFGGKGSWSIHWAELICMSIDKNYAGLRSVVNKLQSSEIAPMESECDNLKEYTHTMLFFTIAHFFFLYTTNT